MNLCNWIVNYFFLNSALRKRRTIRLERTYLKAGITEKFIPSNPNFITVLTFDPDIIFGGNSSVDVGIEGMSLNSHKIFGEHQESITGSLHRALIEHLIHAVSIIYIK